MLSDAEIERYARHVVLPEVGGRGQERLLASRVTVLGNGPASEQAADLLRRAGVTVTDEAAETVVDLRLDAADPPTGAGPTIRGRLNGTSVTVLTLPAGTRQPGGAGSIGPAAAPTTEPLVACAHHALGALAATEALVLLLAPSHGARRTTLDVATGVFTATALVDPA